VVPIKENPVNTTPKQVAPTENDTIEENSI
jgi:hypothetical protein